MISVIFIAAIDITISNYSELPHKDLIGLT